MIFNEVEKKLETALHKNVELSKITIDVVSRYPETYPNERLKKLSENPDKFKEYLKLLGYCRFAARLSGRANRGEPDKDSTSVATSLLFYFVEP